MNSIKVILSIVVLIGINLISQAQSYTNGLVGYYEFNGNANDQSGNGNDGTAVGGASYVVDLSGSAAAFNGNSQYISLPNTISNYQDISVTFWVKTGDIDPNAFPYGTFLLSRDIYGYDFDWNICLEQGRKVNFVTDGDILTTPQDLNSNMWVQIGCVADSSNQVKTLFLNGQKVASASWTPNPFANNNVPIFIGASTVDTDSHAFYNGELTQVRLYNRALSANEVQAIYDAENPDQCTPPTSGLVGWWKGEGNLLDTVNTNNGSMIGNVTYTNGEVGQGFNFDGGANRIIVPDAAELNFGANQDFSIEAWIQPDSASTDFGVASIVDKRSASGGSDSPNGYEFCLVDGAVACRFESVSFVSTGPDLRDGFFHHVALTVSRNSSTGGKLYADGVVVLTFDPTALNGSLINSEPLRIGNHAAQDLNCFFKGIIDEASLYNRSLSSNEIAAVYNAGSAGKCVGSIPPQILMQPVNQSAIEGSNVVLSVTASGTGPFSYQWNFNGKKIFGATDAALTLTNLHPNQSGNYTVTVTTPYGKITSGVASVNVIAQTILIYKYSGTEKITGGGQAATIAYSGQLFFIPDTTNGVFVGWSTVNGKKQYWVNPFFRYLLITVTGASKQTFTLLGEAGQEIDSNGYPHLLMDLHKGQNALLIVSVKKYISFPNTFANTATSIYPSSTTGKMILNESTSAYVYSAKDTQTANNNGQTMSDLINALSKSLASQGYKKQ